MRGADVMQESLFVLKTLNDFVPADHVAFNSRDP
jgi:hypothetical protein